ncbi:MAG: aminoglycoside phosphotransferase family protein [Chloroflexota bacterium]|nr:aminoglycoside phosphotransferase family protein [Chloroflexota bacterium]
MKLDLRFIIPGPTPGTVLRDADGRLPAQMVEGDADEATVVAATACLRERFALTTPILESHPKWEGVPDGEPIPTLVMTEPVAADWATPDGLAFAPIAPSAEGLPDVLVPRADDLLGELRTGAEPPDLRPRWARRGWHERASAWMSEALAAVGRPLLEPPRPFYLRGISALLHGRTADGDVFLKAVFPPFHPEPVVGRLLAERFPTLVPRVVAIDVDEGWLIVDDVAAPWISDLPTDAKRAGLAAGARAVVAIQNALVGDLDAFVAAGCPIRPLDGLADATHSALGPDGASHAAGAVSPERRERAVAATHDAVARVHGLGFPTTLIHGDFHAGNAALVEDRAVIIDWSDAAISNPAVDLVTWLNWSREEPEEQRVAIDAWVTAWSTTGTVESAAVRAAIDDILVVGAAYQVVSYDGILRALEPATRYTLADAARSFLTELESMDAHVDR